MQAMLAGTPCRLMSRTLMVDGLKTRPLELTDLRRFVAGADVFAGRATGRRSRGSMRGRNHAETGKHGPDQRLGGGIAKVG